MIFSIFNKLKSFIRRIISVFLIFLMFGCVYYSWINYSMGWEVRWKTGVYIMFQSQYVKSIQQFVHYSSNIGSIYDSIETLFSYYIFLNVIVVSTSYIIVLWNIETLITFQGWSRPYKVYCYCAIWKTSRSCVTPFI